MNVAHHQTMKLIVNVGHPQAIINSLWLYNTTHFGLRGRQEHLQMLWGDIELKTESTGQEFLEFTERVTKTRQGSTRAARAFPPKIFATGRLFHVVCVIFRMKLITIIQYCN